MEVGEMKEENRENAKISFIFDLVLVAPPEISLIRLMQQYWKRTSISTVKQSTAQLFQYILLENGPHLKKVSNLTGVQNLLHFATIENIY